MRVLPGLAAMLALCAGAPPLAARPPASRPVVVELFTSEGCSSCPPAEALLAGMARDDPGVLALAFHVTYWDGLGWKDPFALPAATERQRAYEAILGVDSLYTPQLVVDGTRDVIGSDRPAVRAAIAAAAARQGPSVPLGVARVGNGVVVSVGQGSGRAELLLLGYDGWHTTPIARGENAGRVVVEAHVVRAIRRLGTWEGAPLRIAAPAAPGDHLAVLLQAADGRILGAAAVL